MKKFFKQIGVIAFVAVIGFSMIACDSGGGGGGGGGDPTKVAMPTASPAAGAVASGTAITLSTSTAGASIRYTINGNDPTPTSGTEYASPITITAATTIKAIAYKDGMTNSGILTAAYTVGELAFELIASGSNADTYRVSKGTVTSGAVVIPATYNGKSVTEIGSASDNWDKGAFYETSITSVTIPDSVTSIGDWAFYECRSLTSVTIGNSVTSIGDHAFRDSGLTSITIPNSVTSIGGSAFSECIGLTSITIPDNVMSIGDWAFQWCSGLTSITIPASVTSIGSGAFLECSGLTSITVNTNNPNYTSEGGILYNKAKTTLIAYPSASGNITIPNSVTSISGGAFFSCDRLTSVTIPASVTSIGRRAFNYCDGLTSVTFQGTISAANFNDDSPFRGDLRAKYLATGGGIGTYTTANPGDSATWTKQ